MDAKDKKFRNYNFTDLQKCMEFYGYTPGYFIEQLDKKHQIEQKKKWFCIAILLNKYRIKQSKRMGRPDLVKSFSGKTKARKNRESDDLYAIRMDLKQIEKIFNKIPGTTKTKSISLKHKRMKEFYQKIMRSVLGKEIRKDLAKITKDSRYLKNFKKKIN